MNTRSLRFQLIGWYAGLLVGGFAVLGLITYFALQGSLVASLRDNQLRRARQIAQLLRSELESGQERKLGDEIQSRYAPGLNDRFVRVSRMDGAMLYLSEMPRSQSFDPAVLPPPAWPATTESARQAPLLGGRKMLLTSHLLQTGAGEKFLVETGAAMDDVQADLRKWMFLLVLTLPLVVGLAVAGGYVLVKRALSPVDRITASAEQISLRNPGERLPVAQTGDELERLSLALNHMLERLDAAFQYSRRLVADASHELRTPLTVLRGELETLAREPATTGEWREKLGSALEEVERLTRIVEGLFAISRLDAGEAAAEWEKFDLAQLASSTADQMSLLAEDKSIAVTCSGTAGIWVEGDRARLKQVVVNLLDNAIKYTPRGGSVGINVAAAEGKAVLEVSDTGIGIPAGALPRVFDRFFRVDRARTRDDGGSGSTLADGGAGLGLSIVKSICTAHHGQVDVTSTPGQGSRFRVQLPLADVSSHQSNGNN